jgi:predicted TPR repeat methyltransferase
VTGGTNLERYTAGDYLASNPSWHVEDSPWKAANVMRVLDDHGIHPRSVCEVGCGAGEILRVMRDRMPAADFVGYEVSNDAIDLAREREGERLRFELKDFLEEDPSLSFDVVLVMDVIEHLEDYFGFLRGVALRARHVVLHIPLDMFALSALRPHALLESRREVGHIHYFLKDTALASLADCGLETVDWRYTSSGGKPVSAKDRLLHRARKALFRVNPDLEVRLLGGHSLLVLASTSRA